MLNARCVGEELACKTHRHTKMRKEKNEIDDDGQEKNLGIVVQFERRTSIHWDE
jgi:hypothetical protein